MEENYFDPDRFRMSLNSFIQEARNVTFILQKNKKELLRFEEWYAGWQEKLKADKILRWIVDSRNRITKQRDLEIKSQCFIVFTADWTDELTRRFHGNPLVPTPVLARQILMQLPKELISDESLICIERKWVDSSLPETELLQVTGHALRVLSELMHDAHNSLVAPNYPDFKCPHSAKLADAKQNYSFELANAEELRKVWMRADNLELTRYSLRANTLETNGFEAEKIRYAEILPELKQIGAPNDLESAIKHYKLVSKQILIKDGFHLSMVFAMSADGKRFYNVGLKMDDRAGKHIAIRRVASLLAQDSIRWAVMVGEVWFVENVIGRPLKHASEFPDRKEALVVQGVSCDGHFINCRAVFCKTDSKIVVEDWVEDTDTANIMLPILNAIRVPTQSASKVSEK
jgi:hypothetical protein